MAEGETTKQEFELLALRENKERRYTEFIGVNGEHGTGFYVMANDIRWEVNEKMDKTIVTVETTDYGDFVGSNVYIRGLRQQLELFLRGLGFSAQLLEQAEKAVPPDTM